MIIQANDNTWSKLGIDDPRVERCYDRGNSFFDVDVPMPSRHRPISSSLTNQNWRDLTDDLSNDLFNSLENPIWGGDNTNFLPRGKFRTIVTPERVRAIVAGLGTFNSRDLDAFVQAAFHGYSHNGKLQNPSVKLFATLVCCDAVDHYLDLVYWGISDVCLPPVYVNNDSRRPLKCKGGSCGPEHMFLERLPIKRRKVFYEWAYALNAPYFRRPKLNTPKPGAPTQGLPQGLHHHYILSDDDILPIVSSKEQEPGTSTRMSRQRNSTSGSGDAQEGGFSTVTRVEFHPDHFDFGSQDGEKDGEKYKVFALKKLTASDQQSFSNEIASLLAFISNDNEHLVKLLTSFEIQRRGRPTEYYLLFPWADGTLWDCWKLNDAVDKRANLPQWMSHQCYQLAKALKVFHNERENQLQHPDIEEDQRKLYGRHGDVKAENILWFKDQKQKTAAYLGRLVLNDFGLARLNSKISRSNQDPNGMPRTKTYQAPEFDVSGSKISRVSDIFSLGCAFLEFTTWIVEGFQSVDVEFTDERTEADPQNPAFKLDTFFKLVDGPSGEKVPIIKPKVKEWIQRLRKHPNCTQFVADFLDLIEEHMLEPNPKKRWESERVVRRLETLRKTCHTDTTYWKDPINVKKEKDKRKDTQKGTRKDTQKDTRKDTQKDRRKAGRN
ncbi:kinase-like domain-containing protein [Apiospora arundinis]|uniref:Kinase-like domain-containing protein n=1 Tax=Apiospora arundinis TaxID=335852 RepID=A0ABR2ISA5_9PEZI